MASTSEELSFSGVLERGLAIIELLAGSADGMPLSAISDELRIPRSATHRLLTSLSAHGYVRQEVDRGTYVLTSKVQVLGFRHLSASGFVDAAQPVINRLAMETGELVRLAVADNGQLTWVARAQGSRSGLRYDPDMGMEARLSCSATGYAWLSRMSNEEAVALVEAQGLGTIAEFGPAAPQSVAEVMERVEVTRQRGYSIAVQTFTDWMSAMAAPLLHPVSENAIGVVSVAGPVFRLTEARLHECAPLLVEAVEEISHLIPGSPSLMNPAMAALSARQGLIS
jgi:DNA-binding IclR family transcriptional regulator